MLFVVGLKDEVLEGIGPGLPLRLSLVVVAVFRLLVVVGVVEFRLLVVVGVVEFRLCNTLQKECYMIRTWIVQWRLRTI